jgi:hypothetical protein
MDNGMAVRWTSKDRCGNIAHTSSYTIDLEYNNLGKQIYLCSADYCLLLIMQARTCRPCVKFAAQLFNMLLCLRGHGFVPLLMNLNTVQESQPYWALCLYRRLKFSCWWSRFRGKWHLRVLTANAFTLLFVKLSPLQFYFGNWSSKLLECIQNHYSHFREDSHSALGSYLNCPRFSGYMLIFAHYWPTMDEF